MSENFKLTAIPFLLAEGDDKGQLETVTFIAASGSATHKWWAVNTGTLEADFNAIVSPPVARDIVNQLRKGETVTFPDLYTLASVYMRFGGNSND